MFEFDVKPNVTFVGSYLPRVCGIATFTYDLAEAIAGESGFSQSVIVSAMNDRAEGYAYDNRVKLIIREDRKSDYRMAAKCINSIGTGVVSLQHEFGIYGGEWGDYILEFLNTIRRPVIATCHTVPVDPEPYQLSVLRRVVERAEATVVMHRKAVAMMESMYGAHPGTVSYIRHGIHDVPFTEPTGKDRLFGVEGPVILTFGLLHRNKGIEYMIDAMPSIVRTHPDATYVILGATHPHILGRDGENYRDQLIRRTHALGVEDSVVFLDKFVDLPELLECLRAADIFAAPYLEMGQVTSGVLAYAVGAGKAVVATPFLHAQELLADGRGRIVSPRDSAALADELLELLNNRAQLEALRRKAYAYGREMIWPVIARSYMDLFDTVLKRRDTSTANRPYDRWVYGTLAPPKVGHTERRHNWPVSP